VDQGSGDDVHPVHRTVERVLTTVLDGLLDRTVVPGFSRIGYVTRRRWWAADPAPDSLRGKVVAVTGANSGLGKATALGAARLGASVRMLCRDTARGVAARDDLLRAVPGAELTVDECDLGDLAGARAAAERLREAVPYLHALVHNAGVLPPHRSVNADGHELTVAVHVLGPHVLTDALRPALAADGDARVIFVSSGGMYTQRLPVGDWEYERDTYRGATAYARSKRMQVVLAERWARELAGQHITVHSMHPGWAATPGIQDSLPGFARLVGPVLRSADEGADTTVWLLAAHQAAERSGLFWHDRRPRPTSVLPGTRTSEADADALWRYVVDATGVPSDG
jgi:NAD(P)-dependent dehydrogenase (short-subunit alcohol dehydrogenase family)